MGLFSTAPANLFNSNHLLVNTGQNKSLCFCFSLPNEVCTVISDADCITPMETVCNAAAPSPDCQLILRQFFNDSGVFCINVSLTNDVSLAVASARVSVTVGGWKLNELNTGKVSQYSAETFFTTNTLLIQPLPVRLLELQPQFWVLWSLHAWSAWLV